MPAKLKCVVVGDSSVGKTCMLISQATKQFPCQDVPDAFENHEAHVMFEGQQVAYNIWDLAERPYNYDRLRPLSYIETDVFLLCFDITNPNSFENIKEKWAPEVRHFCPNVPIILVGTKLDLRGDKDAIELLKGEGLAPIQHIQGLKMQDQINASSYFECSALTQNGLKELYEEIIRFGLNYQSQSKDKQKKKKCAIL